MLKNDTKIPGSVSGGGRINNNNNNKDTKIFITEWNVVEAIYIV